MKIQNLQVTTRADARKVPKPIYDFVQPLTDQTDRITTCLQGLVTLEDNMAVEVRTLKVKNDTATRLTLTELRAKPLEVRHVHSEIFDYPHLAWRVISEKEIEFKVKWDSVPTTAIVTTLAVYASSG